jgi:type II secretory pathway predicted ATPase ExeA
MKNKTIDSDQSLINSPDSENFFISPRIQQPYQKLLTGLLEGQIFFTLTGESGLGKTFLMQHITHGLGVNTQLIKVQKSNTEYSEFFNSIGKEARIDLSNESTLAEKVACLTRCFRAQPEQHIIIEVDQAQEIKRDTLDIIFNWVKLISSEQNHSTYIQIVLLGLPSLDDLLKKSGLQKLDKKKICQCKLKPLIGDEILDYINFYLSQSEDSTNLFEQEALEKIAFYSKGIPGLINKLCDLGLLTISMNQTPTVTATVIDEVADNCLLTHIKSPPLEHPASALNSPRLKANKPNKPTTSRKIPETLLTELLAGKHPLPLMDENELENKPLAQNRRTEEAKTLMDNAESLSSFSEPVINRHDEADKTLINKPDNLYVLSEPVTNRRDEVDKTLIDKPGRLSSLSEPVFTRRNEAGKTFTDKLDSIPKTATPRNSFIIGLGIGALLSIGGFLALNQNWLGNQEKAPSPLQSENNSVKPKQTLQNIKIAKRSATSVSMTPE